MNNTPLINIEDAKSIPNAPENALQATFKAPIGTEQVRKFTEILQKYKSGKTHTEQRVIAAENWWKLRNTAEEEKETNIGKDGSFVSKSGWLHNVITSKHSDAMAAYPEPAIMPREASDKAEATMLSAIVPCVMEQTGFEATYSDVAWQKMRGGTGVYKVIWDAHKNGIGDIAIESVSILNLFWEPGIKDIQKSRYFFHTELCDKDILEQMYPEQLKDGLRGGNFVSSRFLYDDNTGDENKTTVIEVYYHKYVEGRKTLQYCKYVNDVVLFATENETQGSLDMMSGAEIKPMSVTGLYDHGLYPYVFDVLYPVEGSPCGYGYVDLCKNPQTALDILKTSFVKNAMVGAIPRYFGNDSVNEEEFLDLSKPIVHVKNVREDALRKVEHNSLDGNYINIMMQSIQELRETSGNTETGNGVASSVTTASGIAALQEASGKGSRDSSMTAYRAYSEVVKLVIELIRQFYDAPRHFRILGEYGAQEFVTYTNKGLKPQHQGDDFGRDMGYRLPVFDIKISAQKKTSYNKQAQNELALTFFKLGLFNAQMTDSALLTLDMMEFDDKDIIMQKIAKNGTMFDMLTKYLQLAFAMAQRAAPQMLPQIQSDFARITGGQAMPMGASPSVAPMGDGMLGSDEPAHMEKARERAQNAAQPT
jgi:hypothetical protein